MMSLTVLTLAGCGGRYLALDPAQCPAPTDDEAAITMKAWKGR